MPSNRERIRELKRGVPTKKAAILSGRMNWMIKKCANNRGDSTEKRVEEALEALRQEGRIASFYMTKKWSRQDKCGIDAVIYLNDGTEKKFQVKSSVAGIEKHLAKQEEFGGEEILVFYGNYLAGESFAEYKERIFSIIGDEESK